MKQVVNEDILLFFKDHRFSNKEICEYLNKLIKERCREVCEKQKELIVNSMKVALMRQRIEKTANIIDIEEELLKQENRQEFKQNKIDEENE